MNSIFKSNYILITYNKSSGNYNKKLCTYLFSRFPINSKILDLGCGNGQLTNELVEMGFDVYGADIFDSGGINFNYKKVDLQVEPYSYPSNFFDVVFSKSVIEHLREPNILIDEAFRILKPGGYFICLTPSWKHTYKEIFYLDHTHITPFTKHSLILIYKLAGFKSAECKYFYQLPFIWKYPKLKFLIKILNILKLPYNPFYNIVWPDKINTLIRFSREVMLLCVAKKI